jgi:hypothetical protein
MNTRRPRAEVDREIVVAEFTRWAVLWWSVSQRDARRHLIFDGAGLALFRSRREARDWATIKYGYIKARKDLRVEPHCWRMPKAVRVEVTARLLNAAGKGKRNGKERDR